MTQPNYQYGAAPVWIRYIDYAQAKRWLQIAPDEDQYDDLIEICVDAACDWIQDFLSRPIAPTTFARRYDGWSGWNGATVMLEYYPVIQLFYVAETRGNAGTVVLQEQTPENEINDAYQIEYQTGRLIRVFGGLVQRPWFPGSRNIEVVWQAGYNPLPPKVRLATIDLVQYWYRNMLEALRSAKSQVPAYGEEGNMLWPAVPNRITMLLEPYQQVNIA